MRINNVHYYRSAKFVLSNKRTPLGEWQGFLANGHTFLAMLTAPFRPRDSEGYCNGRE